MGIGQGGVIRSSVRFRDQGWFGQFRAVSITEASSFLIVHNTSGNILIVGNAYSLAAGQCNVCTSTFSGEWNGAKNSGQCTFSLMANRPPSAVTLPCRVQIIRSDPRCNFHSPWGIPLPRRSICPAVQETGDVRCSDGEKWQLRACTELWIIHSRTRRPWWFMQ